MKQSAAGSTGACRHLVAFIGLIILSSASAQLPYDANGNILANRAAEITVISYTTDNHVERIVKGTTTIMYTYDALGSRLAKTVQENNSAPTNYYYIDGLEYGSDKQLRLLATEEGRVVPGSEMYAYNLADHLGNVRASFTVAATNNTSLRQVDGYYPFGMRQPTVQYTSGIPNNYLLTGKEYQPETGGYDFGARMLNPGSGRWEVMDPLAEKYYPLSPYAYVANNPLGNKELNGKDFVAVGRMQEAIAGLVKGRQERQYIEFNPKTDQINVKLLENGDRKLKGNTSLMYKILLQLGRNKEPVRVRESSGFVMKTKENQPVYRTLKEEQAGGITLIPCCEGENNYFSPNEEVQMIVERLGQNIPGTSPAAYFTQEVQNEVLIDEFTHAVLYIRQKEAGEPINFGHQFVYITIGGRDLRIETNKSLKALLEKMQQDQVTNQQVNTTEKKDPKGPIQLQK